MEKASQVLREAAKSLNLKRLKRKELCDNCLGRLLAKVGHGLSNEERGRILRTILGMKKTKHCSLCLDLFKDLKKLRNLVFRELKGWEFETFLIGSRVDAEMANNEEALWSDLGAEYFEPMKSEINREVGKLVSEHACKEVDFENPDIVAIIDTAYHHLDLQVTPLFLRGRYRKLVRGIPQTKWPCKECEGKGCKRCNYRGKIYKTSVEEIIASVVLKKSGGENHSFHGMGREDVDAKMLGNGRPFILEIGKPRKRNLNLRDIEEKINKSRRVKVSGLRKSSRQEIALIKEDKCDKTYKLVVLFSKFPEKQKLKEGINTLKGAKVHQRTPTRVAHRRADKTRRRIIKDIKMLKMRGKKAELLVRAEAGTYIKEFIHGDKGRTRPNLAQVLGIECDVVQLDVMRIHDDEV